MKETLRELRLLLQYFASVSLNQFHCVVSQCRVVLCCVTGQVTVVWHCVVSTCHVNVSCQRVVSTCRVNMSCHRVVSTCRVNVSYCCNVSCIVLMTHLAQLCHYDVSLCCVIVTCHCVTKWLVSPEVRTRWTRRTRTTTRPR